jgi:hypothetical protein
MPPSCSARPKARSRAAIIIHPRLQRIKINAEQPKCLNRALHPVGFNASTFQHPHHGFAQMRQTDDGLFRIGAEGLQNRFQRFALFPQNIKPFHHHIE